MQVGIVHTLPSLENYVSLLQEEMGYDPELEKDMDEWEDQIKEKIHGTKYAKLIWNKDLDVMQEIAGYGGLEYENKVYKAAKDVEKMIKDKKKFEVVGSGPTGGFDSGGIDLQVLVIDGKSLDLEIKMDKSAQMGGSSCRYKYKGNEFEPVKKDISNFDLINAALLNKKKEVDRLIGFIMSQEPKKFHAKNKGFPLRTTKEAWQKAQDSNLLVNEYIEQSATWITNHYNKKGIHYIQIGGSGLYSLGENILNLPDVPSLDNLKIKLMLRSARSGSAKRMIDGESYQVASALIRVQGRLDGKGLEPSPFTFDDPKTIQSLMKKVYSKNE